MTQLTITLHYNDLTSMQQLLHACSNLIIQNRELNGATLTNEQNSSIEFELLKLSPIQHQQIIDKINNLKLKDFHK